MESPAANSSPNQPQPLAEALAEAREQAGVDLEFSPGIIDFQARERRAELLKFACEIAAVGRSYREVHHTLFGYSFRRVLSVFNPAMSPDLASLVPLLESIETSASRIELELDQSGLDDLPRRAKTAIAFRDALTQYARAIKEASGMLNSICQCMHKDAPVQAEHASYGDGRFKVDKAAYDASVQEFRRWGERLTELTGKL